MAHQCRISGVATVVFTDDGETSVVYHSTRVVKFDRKYITLNTGGWKTSTTKIRMNQAASEFNLGYRVFSRGGDWFVTTPIGEVYPFTENSITFTRAGLLTVQREMDV